MPKIGPYYWIRAGIMVLTLASVIYLMGRLNPTSRSQRAGQVNICPTRVTSVSVIGQSAVLQDELKWYRSEASGREELDPVAVEKWFAKYCLVKAEAVDSPDGEFSPVLTLAYVTGLSTTLQQHQEEPGIFRMNERYFRSEMLSEAIDALTDLPVTTHPGSK